MQAKDRIRAIMKRQPHDRLGWNFNNPEHQDIMHVGGPGLSRPEAEGKTAWGYYPELLGKVPGFRGEVCMNAFGNISGRLQGKTGGECVRGALEDGWEGLDNYRFPVFNATSYTEYLKGRIASNREKYILAEPPIAVFAILRDIRRIGNALADTVEEPENIIAFLGRLFEFSVPILDIIGENGVDGIIIFDDWGTQNSPFISPKSFGQIFQPAYARLAEACHSRGLDFVMHSCGMVYPLVGMLVEAGVDAFQFDQPELTGSRVWAEEYGRRVAFYCPTDIQKVLATGDRDYIEKTARNMCDVFRANGGNLICKDYGDYQGIGVLPEWARWAENVIVAHSTL